MKKLFIFTISFFLSACNLVQVDTTAIDNKLSELEVRITTLEEKIQESQKQPEVETPEEIQKEVQPEPIEEKLENISFDTCGSMNKYAAQPWFKELNQEYKTEFLSEGQEENSLNISQACLSSDESLFIFIPENSGCGKLFSYRIKSNKLNRASGQYCASEFGRRVGDYITFSSNSNTGKFYFLDTTVTDVNNN